MSDVLFLLSGRLGNSLRLILVLGFFGGFLGKSRNFIVFYFLPSLDHPCHLRSKVPPPPSLGMLLEKAFPSSGNWNLCSYTMYKFCECFFCRFVHRHGYLANQFIFFFFQVCFLRATKMVYRRQFFFLSLYHLIPPLPLLPPFTKIFWLPFQ